MTPEELLVKWSQLAENAGLKYEIVSPTVFRCQAQDMESKEPLCEHGCWVEVDIGTMEQVTTMIHGDPASECRRRFADSLESNGHRKRNVPAHLLRNQIDQWLSEVHEYESKLVEAAS